MKNIKLFLVSVLSVTFCLPCAADQLAHSLQEFAIKSDNLKQIPASVRLQTPTGLKTRECSMVGIGERGENVLLHLYSLSNEKTRNSYLDIFVRRQNSFRRINSVKLSGVGDATINDLPGIVFVDPRDRTMPIVPIDVPTGAGPNERTCWVLTFGNGVTKKPVVQKFPETNDWIDLQIYFDRIDDRGYVVLNYYYSRTQGGPDYVEQEVKLFYWNGRKFEQKKDKSTLTKEQKKAVVKPT